MTEVSPNAIRPTFTEVTEHFNPAWFASVMGTAVVPLAVSFLSDGLARPLAAFFIVISVVLFLALLVPWTLRFINHRDALRRDLDHPVAANFFPTMPIAIVIIALDLLKFPDLFFSTATSRDIAWVLWIIGTVGIFAMGFAVLPRVYHHKEIELNHANFGWYIPPVSKLLVPVAGLELAELYPSRFEIAFGLSMASFGIGFLLFMFVGSMVYQRHVLEALPPSRLAATSFIAIAPTAIIAVILFKLDRLFQTQTALDIDADAIHALAVLGLLMSWGFALWAFVMASVIVGSHLYRRDLPYALSWWAFTFPSGALAVSTGVAWKATGFESIHTIYVFNVIFLLTVWVIVAVRTTAKAWAGDVFRPAH